MAKQISFAASKAFSVGVELELQLLDRTSLNLSSRVGQIMDSLPAYAVDRIKPEFIQSMVEVNTEVCSSVIEVEKDLLHSLNLLNSLAEEDGYLVYAASLHPFARYDEQVLTPGKRYKEILVQQAIAGRRLISQGLHVHIGLTDPEIAIRVCNEMRRFLPVLLAFSSSSPFYQGVDTGFHSYRSQLLNGLARSGIPSFFKDWNSFQQLVQFLQDYGIIMDVREIWWDVRLQPDFGTIEIRITDIPARFDQVLAIVALVQALVCFLANQKVEALICQEILETNKWQAARYGLNGYYLDSRLKRKISLLEFGKELLNLILPVAQSLKTDSYLAPLQQLLDNSGSSGSVEKQRAIYQKSGDFRKVIKTLQSKFLER